MKELYENLMKLSLDDDTPFFHSEQVLDTGNNVEHYRIFSYHFTDKDSWLLPDALESRGVMFEVTEAGEFIRIASRPMQKFFNKGEVDFIEYGEAESVMTKADGSLISSYMPAVGAVRLKSKTSITSEYAELAMDLMYGNIELFDFVKWCELAGYTVNMEIVSPDPKFRIVLHYPETKLIVLNVRHRETGEYMNFDSIPKEFFTGTVELDALNHLDTATNIEGYVVMDAKGNWWKEKCDWYLVRHRAKDFVNQPRAFVELVLKDEADDVFSLLADQPEVLKEMQELQHKVITKANVLVNTVTKYWNTNKGLSRKDFAIKGKEELDQLEFPPAMMFFTKGEEPDWNAVLLRQIKNIEW